MLSPMNFESELMGCPHDGHVKVTEGSPVAMASVPDRRAALTCGILLAFPHSAQPRSGRAALLSGRALVETGLTADVLRNVAVTGARCVRSFDAERTNGGWVAERCLTAAVRYPSSSGRAPVWPGARVRMNGSKSSSGMTCQLCVYPSDRKNSAATTTPA